LNPLICFTPRADAGFADVFVYTHRKFSCGVDLSKLCCWPLRIASLQSYYRVDELRGIGSSVVERAQLSSCLLDRIAALRQLRDQCIAMFALDFYGAILGRTTGAAAFL